MDKARPWPLDLPPFLWGVATSAHQVEGGNNNDWTDWEAAGHVARGETSGAAVDHWHRYSEDLRLFRGFGINAYRFSIEWSRVAPRPDGFDREALAHYRDIALSARRLGLEPLVTLHHFTLPKWLARRGGFAARDADVAFYRYVNQVLDALGDIVTFFVTFNEPMVYLVMGYGIGAWPPGVKSAVPKILQLARRLAEMHREAYALIKTRLPHAWVSVAKHAVAFRPFHATPWDSGLTQAIDWFFNDRFWHLIRDAFDYLGVNYYSMQWSCLRRPLVPLIHGPVAGESTDMGWEMHPEGLTPLLTRWAAWHKPLIITENGIATRDDALRSRYIEAHLNAIADAARRGVDIRGYFYWSALDNFEWHEGFRPQFGLVGVDRSTGERHVRESHRVLAQWAAANPAPPIEPPPQESSAAHL